MSPKIRGMVDWLRKAGVSPSFAFGPLTSKGHTFAGGGFATIGERLEVLAAVRPPYVEPSFNDPDSEASRAKARARAAASRAM